MTRPAFGINTWIRTADDGIFRAGTGRNAVGLWKIGMQFGAIRIRLNTFISSLAWLQTTQIAVFVNRFPFRRHSRITVSLTDHIFGVVITSILKQHVLN